MGTAAAEVKFIGLIEYDGSMDPAIIVGATEHAVLRKALAVVQYEDPKTHKVGLVLADTEDFLEEHPFPDVEDPAAIAAWFKQANRDDYVGDNIRFTLYGGPAPEGFDPTLQTLVAPDDAQWMWA